jgi:tRNA A37 N6-isopentenylltransferase MiaA
MTKKRVVEEEEIEICPEVTLYGNKLDVIEIVGGTMLYLDWLKQEMARINRGGYLFGERVEKVFLVENDKEQVCLSHNPIA